MPQYTVAQVKGLFFDRARIVAAMDRKTVQALSRVGSFIWTRERTAMKRSKSSAPAGTAPRVHRGDLKSRNYFGYDPSTKSVVIGPAKYRAGTVPLLMEIGGTGNVTSNGKVKSARYAPHPFMGPALAAEIAAGTIPQQWGSSTSWE